MVLNYGASALKLGGDLCTVTVIGLHSNVSQSRIYRLARNGALVVCCHAKRNLASVAGLFCLPILMPIRR